MKTSKFMLLALGLALASPVVAAAQAPPSPPASPAPAGAGEAPPAPAATATPVALSLGDALARALAANPAVARARVDVAASRQQERATLASILPHVSVQGNFTRNTTEAAFGSGADRRIILPENDWNYRLALSQPIYAGNRERKALQQARLATESSRQLTLTAEDQLLLNTVGDYLSVVQGDALIAVEQKNIALAGERRRQAKVLFDAGETTKIEPLRAEADVKSAERRLAAARQQREAAAGRLRIDLAIDSAVAVQEPGQIFPPLPAETALTEAAEKHRSEVAEAATALEIARLEVAKQRGAYLPVVTADGGYLKQKSAFPSDMYGFLTLHLTVPILTGGEVGAKVELARARQQQAELRLAEVQQSVREQVRQALVALATAETSLGLAKEELAASEAEHAQASDLYRAQETTSLDLESAETSLAEARRAVANSQLDRDLAELSVWAAAGMLKETVLPEEAR